MTPEQQAEVLARWLKTREGRGLLGPAPDGLDEDVVEAVYALRPDLAPAPTVTIEEILATVDQAPHLAAWLEGDEDETTLDPDVAETVYALDPARAPAPTVSIDDILGRITAGPLAESGGADGSGTMAPPFGRSATAAADGDGAEDGDAALAEVVPFPQPAPPREEPELAPANVPHFGRNERQRSRDRRWWPWLVGSGAAGVLAAALAALVIGPELLQNGAPGTEMAREAPSAPAASTPVAEVAEDAKPAEPALDATTRADQPAQVAAADPAPPPPTDYWNELDEAGAKEKRAEAVAKAPAPSPAATGAPAPAKTAPATVPAEDDGGEAVADLFDGDEEPIPESEEYWARDLGPGGGTSGGAGLFGGDAVETESVAMADDVQATSESRRLGASKGASRAPGRPKASASNSDIPAEPEGLARGTEAAEPASAQTATTGSTAGPGPDLSGLDPAVQARLRAIEGRANELAAKGRWMDAAKTLSEAIVRPPEIGQWYAAQVARWYLNAGQPQLAMDAANLGFSLGGARSAQLQAVYDEAARASGPPPATSSEPAY